MHGREFLLGTENGFVKVFDSYDYNCCVNEDYGYFMNTDRCGAEFAHGFGTPEEDTIYFHRFNCNNRKFEKYAERKIISAEGIVKSVDFKNGSFVVKDGKDLKDTTYKIHDKFFSEYHIKYLKDKLQKGKSISFTYVIIDGKKIFMRFAPEY
jgi:hypothetical protein